MIEQTHVESSIDKKSGDVVHIALVIASLAGVLFAVQDIDLPIRSVLLPHSRTPDCIFVVMPGCALHGMWIEVVAWVKDSRLRRTRSGLRARSESLNFNAFNRLCPAMRFVADLALQ